MNSNGKRLLGEVNPAAPRHQCGGLLGIDPERRFLSPPSKAGLSAVERVKQDPQRRLRDELYNSDQDFSFQCEMSFIAQKKNEIGKKTFFLTKNVAYV
jgi:hypothetical protein